MADQPQRSELHQRIYDQFKESHVWFLATCRDGEPNVIPVGFKWIEGNCLMIADYYFKETRVNLQARPRVAVSVGLLNPKRGFQIRADATVHRAGPAFDRGCQLLKTWGLAEPWAVIEVPMTEIYLLDPGADAGKRLA